jgi:hypothetical protein
MNKGFRVTALIALLWMSMAGPGMVQRAALGQSEVAPDGEQSIPAADPSSIAATEAQASSTPGPVGDQGTSAPASALLVLPNRYTHPTFG